MHQNSYNNVQQNQNNNFNINEFKKKPLGVLTIDNNGQGYESTFSYINNPRQAKRGGLDTYEITLIFNKNEQQQFLQIIEPFEQQIDAVFNQTSGRKTDYFKPEKDRNGNFTGNEVITFKNTYPVKVYDVNNNEILPAPMIPRGSKVAFQFGVLPFELNGAHGIATTRLYGIKVFEFGEKSSGGFGAPTGDRVNVPSNLYQQGTGNQGQQHQQGGYNDNRQQQNQFNGNRQQQNQFNNQQQPQNQGYMNNPAMNNNNQQQGNMIDEAPALNNNNNNGGNQNGFGNQQQNTNNNAGKQFENSNNPYDSM